MAVKPTKSNGKNTSKDFIFSVGRRRESVARIRLYETVKDGLTWDTTEIKKGDIIVNKIPISEYFPGDSARFTYTEPIRVANAQNKYTFTIRVVGGGKKGQLDAVAFGISRALAKIEPEKYRDVLREKGFLTRDQRIRERRKVGTGGKARRAKQSPKR